MEPQPGRNYLTNNYHYFHRQMLGKDLNLQNGNQSNGNQSNGNQSNGDQSNGNQSNDNQSNDFFIHPKGLRTKLSNDDMENNIDNHEELLLESPNPYRSENHHDFEKEIQDNHSFNLNQLNVNDAHFNSNFNSNYEHQLIPNDNQENNKEELIGLVQSWNDRLSWDNYFICIAFLIASRSTCNRLNVGCVLVKDTRVISVGYNGFLPKMPHQSIVRDNHEQATVHAEQNAICDCAKRGVSCSGAICYVTHYPCIICCRLLLASGITQIKYIEDYKNDELVSVFCEQLGVKIEKI
mgnify:CR=1 FL=1